MAGVPMGFFYSDNPHNPLSLDLVSAPDIGSIGYNCGGTDFLCTYFKLTTTTIFIWVGKSLVILCFWFFLGLFCL